jgi:hypothetical protein
VLRSWTPATTRLLSEGGASAWNVLDHSMEAVSPEDFRESKRGTGGREGLLQRLLLGQPQGSVIVRHLRTRNDEAIAVSLSCALG